MTTVKRVTDLTGYTNVLPYASELFGIYQPLIGWKSDRLQTRFAVGGRRDQSRLIDTLVDRFEGHASAAFDGSGAATLEVKVGEPVSGHPVIRGSLVFQTIARTLPDRDKVTPAHLRRAVQRAALETIVSSDVPDFYARLFASKARERDSDRRTRTNIDVLQGALERESAVAAMLLHLGEADKTVALRALFYQRATDAVDTDELIDTIEAEDAISAYLSLDTFDPTELQDLRRVVISPISIIHLFRQYFFELDTFLGPPESHVWLSPGSSVELVEEYTERTLIERSVEQSFESLNRSERRESEQFEISDTIKQNNDSNIKFGASVTANYSKIEASSSFDYTTSQRSARESAHRTLREQSETVTSELRRTYRTTFRTTSETTETTRTKHILANTTDTLINYELRRKMRQVGIQVQDVGTYLCWQTYVDDPGEDLGLGNLLHVAQSPELSGLQPPEAVPMPGPITDRRRITIPLVPIDGGADNKGEIYVDGVESDGNTEGWGSGYLERIKHIFAQRFVCQAPGYALSAVEFDAMGNPVSVSLHSQIESLPGSEARFDLKVDSVDFGGRNSVQVGVVLHWLPTAELIRELEATNRTKSADFREDEKRAFEAAFIETARERIEAASTIRPRRSAELREEERIVVYRKLIQDMLLNKVSLPDNQTHHAAAELIDAIFDVDKMLYFVSPEWWRPRLHESRQQLFPGRSSTTRSFAATTKFTAASLIENAFDFGSGPQVAHGGFGPTPPAPDLTRDDLLVQQSTGWGDVGNASRDSYYITEDSAPARFGSSLGWLLQLDGDNRRNAFLNAPWVKAVMPIRPGRETAALNWLRAVEGAEGIDGAIYQTDNPNEVDLNGGPLDGQPMADVLADLAKRIAQKHDKALDPGKYPTATEVAQDVLDAGNTVTATPVDRVYEHGFYPLENSFRVNVGGDYEIFDQWIEVLPTDQTVPVEVQYDPKTGRQI